MKNGKFEKGDKVSITRRDKTIIYGVFSHYVATTGVGYIHGDNGKSFERVPSKITLVSNVDSISIEDSLDENFGSPTPEVFKPTFDINKRFEFLESLVRMTARRQRVSLIITGEGGLGKTHTVMNVVKDLGLTRWTPETPEGQYVVMKGYTTAKGLYNFLYEHQDKLILIDDCDEALLNPISKNILKGALDSYSQRIVSWIKNIEGSDIPSEFEFTGSIIFISNLKRTSIDQAILTRSSKVDVSMTVEDKIARMENIISQPTFQPEIDLEDKLEAMSIIKENKHACSLSMRTLLEVLDYKISGEEDWKELAKYVMYS